MTKTTSGMILVLAVAAPLTVAAQDPGLPFDPAPVENSHKKKKKSSHEISFTYYVETGPTSLRVPMRLEVDLLTGQAKVTRLHYGMRVVGETQLNKKELHQIHRALSNAGLSEPRRKAFPPRIRPFPPRRIMPPGIGGPIPLSLPSGDTLGMPEVIPPRLNLDRPDWILNLEKNGEEISIRGNDEALGDRSGLKRLADTLRLTAQRVNQPPIAIDPVLPRPPFPWPRPFPPIKPWPIKPFPPVELLEGFAEWFGRFGLPGGPVAWGVNRAIRQALERAASNLSLAASLARAAEKRALAAGARKRAQKEAIEDAQQAQQEQAVEQQQAPKQDSVQSKGIAGSLKIQ